MLQKILYGIALYVTILFYLFLNGNVQFTTDPLPPAGKLLSPFDGAWTSDTRGESRSAELAFERLTDKVEIYYDERHVPHIYAQNTDDALFAQGFVDAQNRLFQMEFTAMASAGQLSSIIGKRTFQRDLKARRRGMMYAAENAVKGWERHKDFKRIISYTEGVNAYIQSLNPKYYPLEFKIFDITPEEWTPLKTALIFKQMSLTLAGINNDVQSTNLLSYLGREDFEYLYPEHQEVENAVVPEGELFHFDKIYGNKEDTASLYPYSLPRSNFASKEKGIGSNSWAVDGTKTSTGKPILSNDPHLALGLPSVWIESHIHTPDFNAYGVSFPGFPGIMIGFNDYIAWGETNVGQDVEDFFVVEWADETKSRYVIDNREHKTTLRVEEIKIKGERSYFDTVRYTNYGPVFHVSDDGKSDLAMRWICHDIPDTDEFNTFINVMKSKNYNEFLKATESFISPAQNFTFADKNGDIAIRVNGRFPAKFNEDGRFVKYGNTDNNWQEWIPKSQNPQVKNPERGFVSSANQVSADKTYPYYFTGVFERYRNRNINDLLSKASEVRVEDMIKMQYEDISYKAVDFMKMVAKTVSISDINPLYKEHFKNLVAWDCHYKAHLKEPVYFTLFYEKLVELTWDELSKIEEECDIVYPEDWRLLELIEKDSTNKYFDIIGTPQKETARDIVILAINEAFREYELMAEEGRGKTWGEFKPVNFPHIARIPGFSENNIPTNGASDAINATGYSFGPSWRMVISLEDKVKGYGVFPGGQSGNPASKFYKNNIQSWLDGQYHTLDKESQPKDFENSNYSVIALHPKQ